MQKTDLFICATPIIFRNLFQNQQVNENQHILIWFKVFIIINQNKCYKTCSIDKYQAENI